MVLGVEVLHHDAVMWVMIKELLNQEWRGLVSSLLHQAAACQACPQNKHHILSMGIEANLWAKPCPMVSWTLLYSLMFTELFSLNVKGLVAGPFHWILLNFICLNKSVGHVAVGSTDCYC